MIMHMRAGKRGKGRLRKSGKALQMLYEEVNLCMFDLSSPKEYSALCIKCFTTYFGLATALLVQIRK